MPGQAAINGFCAAATYPAPEGHTLLFSLNFNNDAYADVISFNPVKREIAVFQGGAGGSLRRVHSARTAYDITAFAPVEDASGTATRVAFASRKSQQAGILRFYHSGSFSTERTWKLSGNPSKVITGGFARNGGNALLLCGPAMEGIVLAEEGGSQPQTVAGKGSSFSSMGSGDFNGDGAIDVAAYDYLNHEVGIFYNYGKGVFRQAKSLTAAAFTGKLRVTDINLDGYADILLPLANGVQIMYGNAGHTFDRVALLQRTTPVDKCIYGDFNRDGRFDLAVLNKNPGSVTVLFQDQYGGYSQEVEYLHGPGINDIIPYYSRFVNGIAVLRQSGHITLLTRETGIRDSSTLLFGGAPAAVTLFDHANDNITDFCFTDSVQQRFCCVLRLKDGTPGTVYSIPLFSNYSRIQVLDREPYRKRFLLFLPGSRQLELLTVRTDTLGFTREYFYPAAPVTDAVLTVNSMGQPVVFVASLQDGSAGWSYFTAGQPRAGAAYGRLGDSVREAILDHEGNLYFWAAGSDSLFLFTWRQQAPAVLNRLWSADTAHARRLRLFTGDIFNTDSGTLLALVQGTSTSYFIGSNRQFTGIFRNRDLTELMPDLSRLTSTVSPYRAGGLNRMFIGTEGSSTLFKLGFVRKGRQALVEKISGPPLHGTFVVGRLHPANYFAIYTNKDFGTIVFKKL